MRKIAILSAALFLAAPAFAAESLSMDTMLGHSLAEVKGRLAEMGYDVRKGEMENGKIEVYFVKDGKMGEVYVDGASGKVAKLSIK